MCLWPRFAAVGCCEVHIARCDDPRLYQFFRSVLDIVTKEEKAMSKEMRLRLKKKRDEAAAAAAATTPVAPGVEPTAAESATNSASDAGVVTTNGTADHSSGESLSGESLSSGGGAGGGAGAGANFAVGANFSATASAVASATQQAVPASTPVLRKLGEQQSARSARSATLNLMGASFAQPWCTSCAVGG